MIGIVDYGRGNLRSVEKALEKTGFSAKIMVEPKELNGMSGVILPGVGAFADAMHALAQGGWISPLLDFARSGAPFLGICLGMQLLFEIGEEHGEHQGLSLLQGKVVHFPPGRKIPHMGWNTVQLEQECPLWEGIPDESFFYFVHSYYAAAQDPQQVIGSTEYGIRFPSLVGQGNIWGAQFHPEKSSPWGLKLLENFGRLVNKT